MRIFLLSLLLTFNSQAAPTTQDWLIEGLIALKKRNKATGFKLLEQGFESSRIPAEQASFANILAQAQGYGLRRNRGYYAQFALAHAAQLDSADRVRLHTVVADSHFEMGELDLADSAYRKALSISGEKTRDFEYATYKLGWVLLSKKKPYQTYDLWTQWLNHGLDLGLRGAYLRYLGKVWIEGHVRTPQEMRATPARKLFLAEAKNDDQLKDLVDGLYQGIQRDPPTREGLQSIAAWIKSRPLWQQVARQTYETRTLFILQPCSITTWIEVAPPSEEEVASAFAELARCSEEVQAHYKHSKQLRNQRLLEIARGYDQLAPKGVQLWPVAEIYSRVGKQSLACERTQTMIKDLVSHPIAPDQSAEQIKNFEQAFLAYQTECSSVASEKTQDIGRSLAGSSHLFRQLLLDSQQKETPLLAILQKLLKNPAFRRGFTQAASQSNSDWIEENRDSALKLRLWLAETLLKLSPAESVGSVLAMTKELPEQQRVTFGQTLVRIRLAAKAADQCYQELQAYLPWKNATLAATYRLWSLLPQADKLSSPFLRSFAVSIRQETPVSSQSTQTLVYLVAQSQQPTQIWNFWDLAGKWVSSDSTFGQIFFKPSFENLQSNGDAAVSIQRLASEGDLYAQHLKELHTAMQNLDPEQIKSPAPASLAEASFQSEIKQFRRFATGAQHFSQIKFSDNPKLPQQIQSEIKLLSDLRTSFNRLRWTFSSAQTAAQKSFENSVESLAQAINALEVSDSESKAQLQQLARNIRKWSSRT